MGRVIGEAFWVFSDIYFVDFVIDIIFFPMEDEMCLRFKNIDVLYSIDFNGGVWHVNVICARVSWLGLI